MRNFVFLFIVSILVSACASNGGNHADYVTCVRKAERSAPTGNPVGMSSALRRHIEAEKLCEAKTR